MEISACYCPECGLLSTYWVVHKGELFECQCGSRNAKCIGHFLDSSFFGSTNRSSPVMNGQGKKLMSIGQSQISLEFLETVCRQFGFFISDNTLHQIAKHYRKEKCFANQELRDMIIWSLISQLDKNGFHCQLMIFRDVQRLADFIRAYTPRVDPSALWEYLQGINLPLSKFRVLELETHIQRHCYVQRRERFLFTQDFKAALEEYKKGYPVIVSDEAGIMAHGGISETFELSDVSQLEQAVQEFTKFCHQGHSEYYYYIDYESGARKNPC